MTWLRVFFVLGLFGGSAAANLPPEPCINETSTASGYTPGALYLGVLATPNPCAHITNFRGFDRFPVLFLAGALLQFDADTTEEFGVGVRRARLTLSTTLWRRFIVVASGDGAERSIPDAYLHVGLVRTPGVIWESENQFDLSLTVGRRVVPFGLEAQWSDAKRPFLESATAIEQLAPVQRRHGVSLAATRLRHLEVPIESNDTNRDLIWHAELGVFRPFDERDSYAAIGRAFARLERRNHHNGFAVDLHFGASAAVGRRVANDAVANVQPNGDERRYAIEAAGRYRRVQGTAEFVAVSQQMRSSEGVTPTLNGMGGALTLMATLRPNPYRWYTSPLERSPVHHPQHVSNRDATGRNVGIEIDAGIDVMRGDLGAVELAATQLRTAAHFFIDDYAKLSFAYAYETERRDHTAIGRLQLAL